MDWSTTAGTTPAQPGMEMAGGSVISFPHLNPHRHNHHHYQKGSPAGAIDSCSKQVRPSEYVWTWDNVQVMILSPFIKLSANLKARCTTCVSPPSLCEWGKGPYPGVMLLYMQVLPVSSFSSPHTIANFIDVCTTLSMVQRRGFFSPYFSALSLTIDDICHSHPCHAGDCCEHYSHQGGVGDDAWRPL